MPERAGEWRMIGSKNVPSDAMANSRRTLDAIQCVGRDSDLPVAIPDAWRGGGSANRVGGGAAGGVACRFSNDLRTFTRNAVVRLMARQTPSPEGFVRVFFRDIASSGHGRSPNLTDFTN
jgi:hypothetical protein